MSKNKDLTIEETLNLAIKNHQENKIDIAQELYNQVLEINPNHSRALNNIAVIFANLLEYQKAINYYKKAIEADPKYADAHNNLGRAFKELGDYQKAISCYEKAIEVDSKYSDAHSNLATIFYNLGNYPKAINYYEKAIEINSNIPNYHNNLGTTFKELGDYPKAINHYKKAIEVDPKYADAHNNLGTTFKELGDYPKAINYYKKAIEINPNYVISHKNMTSAYISQLDLDNSINSSYRVLKTFRNESKFINQSIPLFRLKHDVQQAQYLISKNYKIEGVDKFQKIGEEILYREENKEDENNYKKKILLSYKEIDDLLPFYKSDYVYKTKKISGSHINSNKNWQEVEDEYFNSSKQIIYIDDFLSEEALQELYEFCLISKVWNTEYYNPFLGAYADQGFISPIHLQIAIELKQKLPKLFGPHILGQFWGFKYDSTLGKGIKVHADFALHNLNFWITPDEFNNDKKSGGLKVYDVPAPDNWTFKDYNSNSNKVYNFLKDNNANCINIPYKFNRAVLFNSAYFHETDNIDFKDVYEGRRINNTYLFGNRLVKKN